MPDSIGRITTGGALSAFYGNRIVDPKAITGGHGRVAVVRQQLPQARAVHPAEKGHPLRNANIQGPSAITVGPDGALWFTTRHPYPSVGSIGISTYPLSGPSRANSITAGPGGAVWLSATKTTVPSWRIWYTACRLPTGRGGGTPAR
jgi:streptogramin lyase